MVRKDGCCLFCSPFFCRDKRGRENEGRQCREDGLKKVTSCFYLQVQFTETKRCSQFSLDLKGTIIVCSMQPFILSNFVKIRVKPVTKLVIMQSETHSLFHDGVLMLLHMNHRKEAALTVKRRFVRFVVGGQKYEQIVAESTVAQCENTVMFTVTACARKHCLPTVPERIVCRHSRGTEAVSECLSILL